MANFTPTSLPPPGARRRLLPSLTGLSLVLLMMLFSGTASATHFRGGTLTWQQAGGNKIRFTLNTSWRRGYSAWSPLNPNVGQTIVPGVFYFGDGSTTNISATVNSVDVAGDIINTTWVFEKTYATAGTYVVNALNSGDRLATITSQAPTGSNASALYNLQAVVNVGAPFNNAPVSSLPPVMTVPINANISFAIPGSDPDGDSLTYRLSRVGSPSTGTNTPATANQNQESGLNVAAPPGFTLAANGTVTMNTAGRTIGQLYAVQVMMEDRNKTTGVIKSKVPVDFLISLVGPSAPPVFVSPTPTAPNNTFSTLPGNPVTFTVAASDPDAGQFVTLKPVPVPLGSTMTPALPAVGAVNGVVTSTFNWTPTPAQVGSYVVTFIAADNLNVQTLRTVNINVLCALDASTTVTNNNCFGQSIGAIDLTPSNFSASGNLLYTWTGPNGFTANTQDVSGLAAGNYSVQVFDNATGCSVNKPVSISAPQAVTGTITGNTPVTCPGGSDGSLTVSASGGTPGYTYSWSPSGGTSATAGSLPAGNYTVSILDANGCTGSVSGTVIQTDNVIPTIAAPADVQAFSDAGICSASNVALGTPQTSDNCSVTISNDAPAVFPLGTTTVTWTVTDGSNNSATATQLVTVSDNQVPVADIATLPTVTGECGADVLSAPTATDNCSGTITGTTTDPLTYSAQGTYTITWTYDDGHGNTSTQQQTVVVDDVTAPAADAATLATVTGECSATVTAVPTATDNCAGPVTGTTSDPLTYNVQGNYTITWTFNDGNGNISTQTQNVVVDDITAPAAPALADVTGECSATATVPTTTDNCAGVVTGTTNDALTYSTQGTHTITWTFNDGNGNITTASQNVIIDDNTAPVPNTAALPTVTGQCAAAVTAPTATDNCAGTVTATTTDATTYTAQGTYTVNWTYNDGNGNISTQQQTVIVHDVTAPVVNAQAAIANCNGVSAGNNYTVSATASDNCHLAAFTWVAKDASNTVIASGNGGAASASFPVGVNTVNWTATDDAANTTTASTTVTVFALPSVTIGNVASICGQNTIYTGYGASSITLTATGSGGTGPYLYSWSNPPVYSNVGSIVVSPTSTTSYTVTVADANGCTATASKTVTVKDVRCGNKNDKVQICHNGNAICVSPNAVAAHLAHGDCLGSCGSATARSVSSHIDLEGGAIVVYPNPAHGQINVALKDGGSAYTSWQITDISGRVVLTAKLNGAVHSDLLTIDVNSLVPGMYLLRATTENGNVAAKFTVN